MTDRTAPAKEASVVELLPCPFCGPGQSQVSEWFDDVARSTRIGCGRCGVSTGIMPRKEDRTTENAIAAWNRRSSPVREGEGGLPDLSLSDVAPSVMHTRRPYEVYSQPLEDRDHAKRELIALVDGTPNFAPHYYAVCKSGLAVAVNAGGRNAASDIAFLAHAANCHDDLVAALTEYVRDFGANEDVDSKRMADDARAILAKASPQMAQSNDRARSGSPSLSPSEPSGRVDEATMAWAVDAAAKIDPNAPRRPYAEFRASLRASDRDAVIEECAAACDRLGRNRGQLAVAQSAAIECANVIRSLKSPPTVG